MVNKRIEQGSASELLKLVVNNTGVKQSYLAEKLGIKQESVSGALNRPKVGADVFTKLMNAMGYEVYVTKDEANSFDVMWKADEPGVMMKALDATGTKKVQLAEKLGLTPSAVTLMVNRQRIGADVLVRALNAMEYKILVGKDSDDGFKPEWELVTK